MKRTQLYLDNDLWEVLHIQAKQSGQTISELVRQAVRGRYLNREQERQSAMEGVIGLWQNRDDLGDTDAVVRRLRAGSRRKSLVGR